MLRFPGVAAATVGAAVIAAMTLGVAPILLASAGSSALDTQLHRATSPPLFLTATSATPFGQGGVELRTRLLGDALRGLPVGRPIATVLGSPGAAVSRPGGQDSDPIQLVTREGFERHVTVVEGPVGRGVWLPASAARHLGIHPGDVVRVSATFTHADARVAAVYRDIDPTRIPDFWVPTTSRIIAPVPGDPPQPPFLLAPLDVFQTLEGDLYDNGTISVDVPPGPPMTLSEARHVAARLERVAASAADPTSPLSGAFDSVATNLPTIVQIAEHTLDATAQPVRTISLAGGLLALVAAGVTGQFMARRRQAEFAVLASRGVGPFRLGIRTVVEAVLPSVVGAVAGWLAARALVSAIGPGGGIGPDAVRSSVAVVGLATVAALAVLGAVTGSAARMEASDRPAWLRGVVARTPWEAAALALSLASLYEIVTRGAGAVAGPSPTARPHVDLLILLFPFLFVAGTAGLLVRTGRRILPRLKSLGRRRSPWAFIALSRLDAAPRLAALLVTSSALGIGVLAYAAVLSSSIASTATEKATLSIGSDVAAVAGSPPSVPGRAGFGWTPIMRVNPMTVGPGRIPGSLMTIDTGTFARAAFWDARLDGDLDTLMSRLSAPADGRLPVVAVGRRLPRGARLELQGTDTRLEVVRTVLYFPGVPTGSLTLVVDRDVMSRVVDVNLVGVGHSWELWAKGDPARILPVLSSTGFPMSLATTAAGVRATPAFLALSWTFGLLQALGILAGAVAALATILYLESRQRSREVSYALARRMGLRRAAHRRSVVLELGSMLLVAFALGAGFAVLGAALVHGRLDPIPNLPPGPVLHLPFPVLGAAAAAAVAATVVGAWRVQRQADRADVGEVMRLA